ncbi:stellacyanin [Sorghum bicolor]|uniref:Phytocyanin domain-containing protein n=1 Tax=Sorghum bicolor TaxID=4558 RepID=C5XAB5_SORBI|nr:stellacyanin [Sorghum bicolor]EER95905.1 hypothetical protein SORBI_3002G044900 [Sorghum bicolor]|eukprot:XP_002459384.1 stellacyanin [Sorghum bicolor]
MASSNQVLVVIVVIAVATVLAAPAAALAADLLVGGSQGWRLDFDYDDWVEENDFIVGDTLVFKYAMGQHNVVQATAASYAACSQGNSLQVWSSGDDRVTLNTSGPWWFFCGVGDHCQDGMKFNINVLPAVVLSPSSPPTRDQGGGDATGLAGAQGGGLAAAGLAAAAGVAVVAALLF